ncbi:MAG TPA: hypothetical protein VGD67_14485 [Pseudonocardiaceae bacterium]
MSARVFGPRHALAGVARRACRAAHPQLTGSGLLGRVACASCWESVIRADARVAAWFDLPDTPPPADPAYVDPVAVDRACAGHRVRLTPAEVRAVVIRLRDRGVGPSETARRVHRSCDVVTEVLKAAAAGKATRADARQMPADVGREAA